jgi:hypothetical protein
MPVYDLWRTYRLRHKRRYLLARAWIKRRELEAVQLRTAKIRKGDILAFATVRNERQRLPYFLDHHRALGILHFLIIDNGSTDGTSDYLLRQPDVSLWKTDQSYRDARFGMDWINSLLMRYGHDHWCLTLDADEALIIPFNETRTLHDLTGWLDTRRCRVFSAMMLDLYGDGPISAVNYKEGQPVWDVLPYYDAHNYVWEMQSKYNDISIRGGVRARVFFKDQPNIAPHLHKTPLVKWHWRFAYVSSTHVVLPRELNCGFDARLNLPTGALLHSKFLPDMMEKARQDNLLREYHLNPHKYDDYYAAVANDPTLWSEDGVRYHGWQGLEEDGILTRGAWR